jgi:hypothetical protein
MSHPQLRAKTGRASAAISKSIDGLVRAELIVVRDRRGRILDSRGARRRSHQHICFGLHPRVESFAVNQHDAPDQNQNSESENDKSNPDKRKQQHREHRSRFEVNEW